MPFKKPMFLKFQVKGILVFALLFLVSLGFQIHSGAWSSDFGTHADEGAHVVTSLMMRDYLMGGFIEEWHPIRYAEIYYERFPKVAIGHYPPLFYVVAALLLIPFRSPEAVLVTMALICAGAGWITWVAGSRLLRGSYAPLLLALLFCVLPLTRTYTATVMSGTLLLVFCLAATLAFGRFMTTLRLSHSLAFGFLATMAILTKGSGLMLAMVPPLAIALSGKWSLLKNWRLWVGAVPVLLLALPWTLLTYKMAADGLGDVSHGVYAKEAAAYYPFSCTREMGWSVCLLFLMAGIWILGKRTGLIRGREKVIEPNESMHWALIGGLVSILLWVPSGTESRYLIPLVPSVLILAAVGVEKFILAKKWSGVFPWLILGLFVIVCVETWRPVEKCYTGADEAIAMTVPRVEDSSTPSRLVTVLIVSNASGEGALTAAAAFQAPESLRVMRGSKTLATSDWLGRGYEVRFKTANDLSEIFSEQAIDFLIVEIPGKESRPMLEHWIRLADLLESLEAKRLVRRIGEIESLRKHGLESSFSIFRLDHSELKALNEAETER